MTGDLDREISEYATGALLRYFRRGALVDVKRPRINVERDREILRGHWALSSSVRALTQYLLLHRHETQTLLVTRPRIDDAIARGRIDARATSLHQLRSGAVTSIVAQEPVRTFETGPNQVLAWVIYNAARLAARLQSLQAPGSAYSTLAENVMTQLDQVRRLDALRDAIRSPAIQRRPAPGALRDAARARRVVYRLAVEAYNSLSGIEEGNEDAIRAVINSTLVGPLEPWRRFEIAVAIAIGDALSETRKEPFSLAFLAGDSSLPILTCGSLALYWQQSTCLYKTPVMDASETMVSNILSAYDMSAGADRPDLLLVDAIKQRVLAVIEVKYLAGDTASTRFREAIEQIVRYSRGYATAAELSLLQGRSLVAMSVEAPEIIMPKPEAVPTATDFSQMMQGSLRVWAGRLH